MPLWLCPVVSPCLGLDSPFIKWNWCFHLSRGQKDLGWGLSHNQGHQWFLRAAMAMNGASLDQEGGVLTQSMPPDAAWQPLPCPHITLRAQPGETLPEQASSPWTQGGPVIPARMTFCCSAGWKNFQGHCPSSSSGTAEPETGPSVQELQAQGQPGSGLGSSGAGVPVRLGRNGRALLCSAAEGHRPTTVSPVTNPRELPPKES